MNRVEMESSLSSSCSDRYTAHGVCINVYALTCIRWALQDAEFQTNSFRRLRNFVPVPLPRRALLITVNIDHPDEWRARAWSSAQRAAMGAT